MKRGFASAYSVYECSWLPDRWQWCASGPNGMTTGGAATEEEAWEKARAAMEGLTMDMTPRGQG